MHFLISLGTLLSFMGLSAVLGYAGGIYTYYKVIRPTHKG